MCECTGQSLSVHTHTWARGETRFTCAHSLCARAAYIRERASGFVREQRKSACEWGDSRSRFIFTLANYINLLSRYKNALSTFGSKITPYLGALFSSGQHMASAVLLLAVIKQRCIAAGAPFWIGGELPVFIVRPHAPNQDARTVTVRYEYMYRATPKIYIHIYIYNIYIYIYIYSIYNRWTILVIFSYAMQVVCKVC